jgi:methyltransferase
MRLSRYFGGLCAAVAAERVLELLWSRAHERRTGARVAREPMFAAMVAVHAGTLVAAPIESALRKPAPRGVRAAAWVTLAAATALRAWALRTLGDAWSVRVTELEQRRVVTNGPYRFIRHPNYLAVILELAALPLAGGAWVTAVTASLLNALVLSRRIPLEESRLSESPGWQRHFAALPRFVPSWR